MPAGSKTAFVRDLEFLRAYILVLSTIGISILLLHDAGVLVEFLTTLWEWSVRFLSWYQAMILIYPRRTLIVTLHIFAGVAVFRALMSQMPKWGQVRNGGMPLIGYFAIQTIFWGAIFIEFPVAILLAVHDAPGYLQWASYGGILIAIAVVYALMWVRPKFRPEVFKGVVAPVTTMIAPVIGGMNRLYLSGALPAEISSLLEWIVLNYQRLILTIP